MTYFNDIRSGIRTTLRGLRLTLRHLRHATHRRTPVGIADATYFDQTNGLVTLQYPHEQLPIPDKGRYRLRNEIDDCIVCDKCAKICPVDCITIDAIKATEEVGRASDGSPIRLYAAKFDIDMAKCCYCGLCTVVCPTECLTMDKKFDYSEFELGKLTYSFANLTPRQADEKRRLYEQFVQEKEAAKANPPTAKTTQPALTDALPTVPAKPRPVFRPTAKPKSTEPQTDQNSADLSQAHPLTDATPDEMERIAEAGRRSAGLPDGPQPAQSAAKPAFRPTMKPKPKALPNDVPTDGIPASDENLTDLPKPKPVFRPTMKPKPKNPSTPEE